MLGWAAATRQAQVADSAGFLVLAIARVCKGKELERRKFVDVPLIVGWVISDIMAEQLEADLA